MPDSSKLEKLNRELEKSEKKLRKAINDEKALQHQLKQLTRKERTHRLTGKYCLSPFTSRRGFLFVSVTVLMRFPPLSSFSQFDPEAPAAYRPSAPSDAAAMSRRCVSPIS